MLGLCSRRVVPAASLNQFHIYGALTSPIPPSKANSSILIQCSPLRGPPRSGRNANPRRGSDDKDSPIQAGSVVHDGAFGRIHCLKKPTNVATGRGSAVTIGAMSGGNGPSSPAFGICGKRRVQSCGGTRPRRYQCCLWPTMPGNETHPVPDCFALD